jgi:hypothetical protein
MHYLDCGCEVDRLAVVHRDDLGRVWHRCTQARSSFICREHESAGLVHRVGRVERAASRDYRDERLLRSAAPGAQLG